MNEIGAHDNRMHKTLLTLQSLNDKLIRCGKITSDCAIDYNPIVIKQNQKKNPE